LVQPADGEHRSIAEAMGAFTRWADYPLMVVTVGSPDGEISGCLAGFVTQRSIQPPRFLVCVSKVNHTYFVAERVTGIALHLLGADQTDLASLFGEQTGDTFDKFEHCHWRPRATGAPVLSDCAAWLEGLIISRSSVGDHQALLIRPQAGGSGSHSGLLTLKTAPKFRRFRVLRG
jgi:flavin reductase (DIM6/NTAB) family NADH-FMN oxidoreductase RutF